MDLGPKDWRPGLPGEQLLRKMKEVAPHIHFSVEFTPDPYFRWDGDGPDPAEEGYQAYDVDFFARAITKGNIVEGQASLGGHYAKPGEFDMDVSGYLPQKLEEAAAELRRYVSGSLLKETKAAMEFLKAHMKRTSARGR